VPFARRWFSSDLQVAIHDGMTTSTTDTAVDPQHAALARLICQLCEDALYTYASGAPASVLEDLAKRRQEAYVATLSGQRVHTLLGSFEGYFAEMTRALTPLHAPTFLPMGDVLREKVTLEIGARGLRSLFSSKPSEKDTMRVKKLGTLAVRILRGVFASDGSLTTEDERHVSAFLGALGLPEADMAPLTTELPMTLGQFDVYGDVELPVARAMVRGAWLAAAWDAIDPREEAFVRGVATKLGLPPTDTEELRNEAVLRVDNRRALGLAAVEGVRHVQFDRGPGVGVQLASRIADLALPARFRDEALGHIGHWTKVQLGKRFKDMASDDKQIALSMVWCAALYENPTFARKALLRARHDRFAYDMGEDGARARATVEDWVTATLLPAAHPMTA
jgi:hypothetical protein